MGRSTLRTGQCITRATNAAPTGMNTSACVNCRWYSRDSNGSFRGSDQDVEVGRQARDTAKERERA